MAVFSHSNVTQCAYEIEKGQGHSEIPEVPLTVQGKRVINYLLGFVNNISLNTHENLQAAKEKQNIPAKSHSSAATDVEKHQACVSELDQQILKQHHLPLDCWEDWWRGQMMLRWLTETWMDTIRKKALRKLRRVITLNTSHRRHRHEVRRRREAVTGKAHDSFLSLLSHFAVVLPSKQNSPKCCLFKEDTIMPFHWGSCYLLGLQAHGNYHVWPVQAELLNLKRTVKIHAGAEDSLLRSAGGHSMRCSLSQATQKATVCIRHKGGGFFEILKKQISMTKIHDHFLCSNFPLNSKLTLAFPTSHCWTSQLCSPLRFPDVALNKPGLLCG